MLGKQIDVDADLAFGFDCVEFGPSLVVRRVDRAQPLLASHIDGAVKLVVKAHHPGLGALAVEEYLHARQRWRVERCGCQANQQGAGRQGVDGLEQQVVLAEAVPEHGGGALEVAFQPAQGDGGGGAAVADYEQGIRARVAVDLDERVGAGQFREPAPRCGVELDDAGRAINREHQQPNGKAQQGTQQGPDNG